MKKAIEILEDGGIILYPTDTLYALGVDARNPEAIQKLFDLKKRSPEKSFSITLSSIEEIGRYAHETPLSKELAEKYLPGPLTLVLQKKDSLANNLTADNTVAIRVPDHPFTKQLTFPITATSANISGEETFHTPETILETFSVDFVVDGGELSASPSTIVDARGGEPIVLRQGSIRI